MNAKEFRGLLIDPKAHTITEVVYNGDYRNIYTHIDAQSFDMVRIDKGTCIFVDDEGLINGKDNGLFRVDGKYPAYLAGKGLVLGTRGEHTIGTKMEIEELKSIIAFGVMTRSFGKLAFVELAKPYPSDGISPVEATGRVWPVQD